MEKLIQKLPVEIKKLTLAAQQVADDYRMPVYLVGGFVRDLLLGVKNLDLDFVVEADGIEFARKLSEKLKASIITHKRFGTATVILKNNLKVDIASARAECYPQPACLPEVKISSLKEDLKRRDFTVNAMALSLNSSNFAELIDYFRGRKDLKDKKIRILHDQSFIDDPTRILRAVRFETRYNFTIEPKTLRLLKSAARKKMLKLVEPQRIRDELLPLLKENQPLKPIKRLNKLAGFGFIDHRISLNNKVLTFLKAIEKQIAWFHQRFPKRRQLDSWLMYLAGLLDSLNEDSLIKICNEFAFRKGETKRICSLKEITKRKIKLLSQKNIKGSEIFSILEPLSYETILLIRAKYKNYYLLEHIKDFFEIYNGMRVCVSGKDLHKMGLVPGPGYREIFIKVLNEKLNSNIKTKKEELALIRKLIRKK